MRDIHVCIVSWRGQHSRAAALARILTEAGVKHSIIFSGSDEGVYGNLDCQCVRRDDALYWSDKFVGCLEVCDPQDIMVVVHADCDCADWPELIKKCRAAFRTMPLLAVWSPRMKGTPWRLEKTRIERIAGTGCSRVAHTDGLVFALSPEIAERMRQVDYSANVYGWGIDWLFICTAYSQNRIVVVDETIQVQHRLSRGYSSSDAYCQRDVFIRDQFTSDEIVEYNKLLLHMQSRKHLAKMLFRLERAKAWVARNMTGVASLRSNLE
jgi:hypothetical protein